MMPWELRYSTMTSFSAFALYFLVLLKLSIMILFRGLVLFLTADLLSDSLFSISIDSVCTVSGGRVTKEKRGRPHCVPP